MTGLVQNPHQGAREIALVIARRDPYIVGRAAAKRMGADVEPAMGEVESDALHEAHRYPALNLNRKRADRGGRRRQSRLTGQDCFEQIGQKTRDLAEQAVDRLDRPSGLVLIEKSFVGELVSNRSALTAAISRSRRSTCWSPGSTAAKSFCGRAFRHTASHSEQARDSASTRAPGTEAACSQRRRISRKLARCQSSSAFPAISASVTNPSTSGVVRCWWAVRRKVASCSVRAAAPPEGIIAAVAQWSTEIACSSVAIRRNRSSN